MSHILSGSSFNFSTSNSSKNLRWSKHDGLRVLQSVDDLVQSASLPHQASEASADREHTAAAALKSGSRSMMVGTPSRGPVEFISPSPTMVRAVNAHADQVARPDSTTVHSMKKRRTIEPNDRYKNFMQARSKPSQRLKKSSPLKHEIHAPPAKMSPQTTTFRPEGPIVASADTSADVPDTSSNGISMEQSDNSGSPEDDDNTRKRVRRSKIATSLPAKKLATPETQIECTEIDTSANSSARLRKKDRPSDDEGQRVTRSQGTVARITSDEEEAQVPWKVRKAREEAELDRDLLLMRLPYTHEGPV